MNKYQYIGWAVKGLVATRMLTGSAAYLLPQFQSVSFCASVAEPTLRYGANKLWQSELHRHLSTTQQNFKSVSAESSWEVVCADSSPQEAYLPSAVNWKTVWQDGLNGLAKNKYGLMQKGLNLAELATTNPLTYGDLKNGLLTRLVNNQLSWMEKQNLRNILNFKLSSIVLENLQAIDEEESQAKEKKEVEQNQVQAKQVQNNYLPFFKKIGK